MQVLLTGGAGFIGSHVAEALLARGDFVLALDSFSDFYDPMVKRRNIKAIYRAYPDGRFAVCGASGTRRRCAWRLSPSRRTR